MIKAKLGAPIPVLPVQHVEEALGFYVERLGFEVDFRYERDPASYAGVKRDDVRLHMHRQDDDALEPDADAVRFRIPVDDPDLLYSEFRAMGALDEDVHLRDTVWGTREFGFRDPDGNRLVFFRIG